MSYTVIARKYRPQTFEEIIGQEHIAITLKNAINKNKLGHAYLFFGPRGVGKTTAARILAKAVNCEKNLSAQPCNECKSCLDIINGKSVDVYEIDGASNRGINEIRSLRETVKYSPMISRYKVYIIDEVHQITPEGFNALLKTLEEPPPHVLFIFATTELHKVPETILSRCQVLNFHRIPINKIIGNLESVLNQEKIKYEIPALSLIAKLGEGSLRDSQSILDQALSFSDEIISLKNISSIFGITPAETFFEIIQNIIQNKNDSSISTIHKVIDKGGDITQFSKDFLFFLRDILIAKNVKHPKDYIDSDEVYLNNIESLKNLLNSNQILLFIDTINKLLTDLKFTYFPMILLEVTILKLHNIYNDAGSDSLESEVPTLKKKNKNIIKQNSPEKSQSQPQENINIDKDNPINSIKNNWALILKELDAPLAALLKKCELDANNKILIFNTPNKLIFNQLNNPEKTTIITNKLKSITDTEINISIDFSDNNSENKKQSKNSNTLKNLEKKIDEENLKQEHPIVNEVLKAFNGKIIGVK